MYGPMITFRGVRCTKLPNLRRVASYPAIWLDAKHLKMRIRIFYLSPLRLIGGEAVGGRREGKRE